MSSASYTVLVTRNSETVEFSVPRVGTTVDDLYIALAKALEVSVSDAHKYELTCEKTHNVIDAEMGQTELSVLAKPSGRKSKKTLRFTAEEIEPVRICVLVTDQDDSSDDSSYISSETSDSDQDSYATSDSDGSSSDSSSDDHDRIRRTARIYMNHEHGDYYDEIDLYRDGDEVRVDYYYDRTCRHDDSCLMNTYSGSVDAVMTHIGRSLRFLAIDRKPYSEIEIDIPFYPSISLVPVDCGKKARRNTVLAGLREFLEEGLE